MRDFSSPRTMLPSKAGLVYGKFTPSPPKIVKFFGGEGKLVKEERINRADRRSAGIR